MITGLNIEHYLIIGIQIAQFLLILLILKRLIKHESK